MRRWVLLAILALAVAGCRSEQDTEAPTVAPVAAPEPVVDMHTSRNALDWAGRYEGLLACADCPGSHVQLTLEPDGYFEMLSRRLVRGSTPLESAGRFDWEAGDNIIRFETTEGSQRFAVGEGRLVRMDAGQVQPAWGSPGAVLAQSTPGRVGNARSLAEILEDHRWTLVDARDADGQVLPALSPDLERPFSFNFAGARLQVEGGCNGLRGAFRIDAEGMLEVSGALATLMACDSELMAADAALSAQLAEPLETVLIGGPEPRLVLLGAAGDALSLSGALTPEARYGAPTVVFLEVDAQRVPCADSPLGDGLCLNVRELSFDAQGLPVGRPTEWEVFNLDIEGYRHEPGVRNVLRVKRFDPPADEFGSPPAVYVLDLVVQSEQVSG